MYLSYNFSWSFVCVYTAIITSGYHLDCFYDFQLLKGLKFILKSTLLQVSDGYILTWHWNNVLLLITMIVTIWYRKNQINSHILQGSTTTIRVHTTEDTRSPETLMYVLGKLYIHWRVNGVTPYIHYECSSCGRSQSVNHSNYKQITKCGRSQRVWPQ